MSQKLFALCQLQLGAIVDDLEQSVGGVNAAASRMMQGGGSGDADLRAIVMGLQFHDELTQRLQHLQSLLLLLAEQDSSADAPDCGAGLLARVAGIFSSQAEFLQLDKVFPGHAVARPGAAIELF